MTLPQEQIGSAFAAPGKIVVATDLTDTEYLAAPCYRSGQSQREPR